MALGHCGDGMQKQGISRILTITLNDVEKGLNIKEELQDNGIASIPKTMEDIHER